MVSLFLTYLSCLGVAALFPAFIFVDTYRSMRAPAASGSSCASCCGVHEEE